MGTRRYKMTPSGERPIWASRRELTSLGREWARMARDQGAEPTPVSNTVHDEACAREWERMTGKFPTWFKAV